MQAMLRFSLWAAAAALLAAFGGVCVSVRGASLADAAKALLDQYDLAVALQAQESADRALDEHKREVGAGLLAGRLSLAEAAEDVYAAEVAAHGDFHMIRHAHPDLPDEEAAFAYAVDLVRRHLKAQPDRAPSALATVQAEYQVRFGHPAPLPESLAGR